MRTGHRDPFHQHPHPHIIHNDASRHTDKEEDMMLVPILETMDKAKLVLQLEKILESGMVADEKKNNIEKFLNDLKSGHNAIEFAKIYDIAKMKEQLELEGKIDNHHNLKRVPVYEKNHVGHYFPIGEDQPRDSINTTSYNPSGNSEPTRITNQHRLKDAKLHQLHLKYLAEIEDKAKESAHRSYNSTNGSKGIGFNITALEADLKKYQTRAGEEMKFETPGPTPIKFEGYYTRQSVPTIQNDHPSEKDNYQPTIRKPTVLVVKERPAKISSTIRPKSANVAGRPSDPHHNCEPEHIPQNVNQRMRELYDLKDIDTDYEERLVYNCKDCGPCWGDHLHKDCYHQKVPLWKRTNLFAKTSTYVPLTKQEIRMLKDGEILHCHYRHNYDRSNINKYFHKTAEDIRKEKEEAKKELEMKELARKKREELSKQIREKNKLVKKKEMIPAVNNRFVAGIADPQKDKIQILPEERIHHKVHDDGFLKPKRPVSEDLTKRDKGHISIHLLRLALQEKKKEEEKKKLIEEALKEEKYREKELKGNNRIDKAKKLYLKGKYSKRLEEEKKKKKEEAERRAMLKQDIEIKRKIILSAAGKKPLEIDDHYVFDTKLGDNQAGSNNNLGKDEQIERDRQYKEEKLREASQQMKLLLNQNQNKLTKRVTFGNDDGLKDGLSIPDHSHTPSLMVKERVKLMDAEREMLTEITRSIQDGADTQMKSKSLENRAYRKTINDNMMLDIQEAQEHDYFGLRPNPNYSKISTYLMKGPPKKINQATHVSMRKGGKEQIKGMPTGRLYNNDRFWQDEDRYIYN